jgi:hypothetical protein
MDASEKPEWAGAVNRLADAGRAPGWSNANRSDVSSVSSALMGVHDVPALANKPENERADCITPVCQSTVYST